jgi:hypothetical protein
MGCKDVIEQARKKGSNCQYCGGTYYSFSCECEALRLGPIRKALLKYRERCYKPGNSFTPWKDFPVPHIHKRLMEEIEEYKNGGKSEELLDVINLAAFLYLAKESKDSDVKGGNER